MNPEVQLRTATWDQRRRGALFLLRRNLRLRRDHNVDLNPVGLLLLDRSIESALLECREVGAMTEARAAIRYYVGRKP